MHTGNPSWQCGFCSAQRYLVSTSGRGMTTLPLRAWHFCCERLSEGPGMAWMPIPVDGAAWESALRTCCQDAQPC
eukprot:9155081-Pyramimonas_sp.AAC.1